MDKTLFFYDLETSGFNPREDRIMQFAGQRTDMDLQLIGDPINYYIKMSDDRVPSVDAVLVTGITPQKTISEGITEAEFAKVFDNEISKAGTIFVGFNSVRFDDEFMRFFFYRNFHDAYQWQWKNNQSRWDLLDLVRMTRALRPQGIKWSVDEEGNSVNRLELLTSANGLDHELAHDALSDVMATIMLAKLIKNKQNKLFEYSLGMRSKKEVQTFVSSNQVFIYTSGKYPSEFEKTAIVLNLGPHPDRQGVLVYDLHRDPAEFLDLSVEEIVSRWKYEKDPATARLPVKSMQFNRCPAVAPMSVLDQQTNKRLKFDLKKVEINKQKLLSNKDFYDKIVKALDILNKDRDVAYKTGKKQFVDGRLYDGFIPEGDKIIMSKIQAAQPQNISEFVDKLTDSRLKELLPLYKARNFPKFLSEEERNAWEKYRYAYLFEGGSSSKLAKYMEQIQTKKKDQSSKEQEFLLDELTLWGESIMPDVL